MRFAFLVAAFECFTLVVIFLALAHCDDEFYEAASGLEPKWHDGVALSLACFEGFNLFAVHEKLAWFGVDGARAWFASFVKLQAKAGALQPELAITQLYVGAFELHVPVTGSTDFGTGQ